MRTNLRKEYHFQSLWHQTYYLTNTHVLLFTAKLRQTQLTQMHNYLVHNKLLNIKSMPTNPSNACYKQMYYALSSLKNL